MKTLLITSLILFSFESNSQKTIRIIPDIIEYKKVDTISLDLHIYRPLNFDNSKKYKTIIFFHGGGWRNGNPRQFRRHAMYFASRGMIAITPEYRLFYTHGTSPLNCVQDANAVMNFIKKNAKNLGINSKEIVVSGGSAGGHLALTTAFWNVSSVIPKALILFNPVTDTSPKGFGFKRNLDDAFQISPIHNVRKNCPPSIILNTSSFKVIPITSKSKSHFLKIASARLTRLGFIIISIRSWLSESINSYADKLSSLFGTLSRFISIPKEPLSAISTDEQVKPAAPISWIAIIESVFISSKHASIKLFCK